MPRGLFSWSTRLWPSSDGTRDAAISARGQVIFKVAVLTIATAFTVLLVLSVR